MIYELNKEFCRLACIALHKKHEHGEASIEYLLACRERDTAKEKWSREFDFPAGNR